MTDGGELMILGKLALTFGLLLGIPLWQWLQVRRLLRRGDIEARRDP